MVAYGDARGMTKDATATPPVEPLEKSSRSTGELQESSQRGLLRLGPDSIGLTKPHSPSLRAQARLRKAPGGFPQNEQGSLRAEAKRA